MNPKKGIMNTPQEMGNSSFDPDFGVSVTEGLGYDGANLQRVNADNLATVIQTSGTDTYVGYAAPGTALATAKWQAMKIDSSGNTTYADGNANFDNVATTLSGLSYS